MAENKTNQRRAQRFEVTPKGELSDGVTAVKVLVQDISDEGMLLVCSKDYAVGTLLHLKLNVSQGTAIECTIEVRHSSDMGTGIRIVDMNAQNRRAYERYLQEYFSHQLGKLG